MKTKMTGEKLKEKLNEIQKMKCETQNLELKKAANGCPEKMYDTLSAFSNQDDGGIIVFGVDEKNDYEEVGVYDAQDLQKKINEQCLQMTPIIRPLLTVVEKDNKVFVSAEIPGVDLADRPCYYSGKGKSKGSYVRVGDCDEPMTEYEVYSYEAFRKKYQDDIRSVPRASWATIDLTSLSDYLLKLKLGKPNLANIPDEDIYELMSITHNQELTLAAVMLFCQYPQAYFPQLSIIATVIPGTDVGESDINNVRFIDNKRIEGTIPQMLEEALSFVRRNMKTKSVISEQTGIRQDKTDYPLIAVREALVNALVHRDYSVHTEGMPIQLMMFDDRLEIHNPGGIYGRMTIDQLGKLQPDTRNPVLATALEVMGVTENRYSGIPTIRKAVAEYGLPEVEFIEKQGTFKVIFYKASIFHDREKIFDGKIEALIEYCKIPRSRDEICAFLGVSSKTYAINTYVMPLVEKGIMGLSVPDRPRSQKQKYYTK